MITDQPSWQDVKWLWNNGQKFKAFIYCLNRMPNMAWPGGEKAYDRQINYYYVEYGSADDLKAWKIVWWREMWHYLGGLILGLTNLPIILCLPLDWYTIVIPGLVYIGMTYKELQMDGLNDRGYIMWKDLLDAFMWFLGSATWLLLLL